MLQNSYLGGEGIKGPPPPGVHTTQYHIWQKWRHLLILEKDRHSNINTDKHS